MVYDKSSYIVAIRNPELLSRHDLVTLYNLVIEANENKIEKRQLLIVQNPPLELVKVSLILWRQTL